MPCTSVAMVKDDEIGEVFVIVNDVGKIGHGFATLVARDGEARDWVWVVQDVAEKLPAASGLADRTHEGIGDTYSLCSSESHSTCCLEKEAMTRALRKGCSGLKLIGSRGSACVLL